MKYFTTFEGVGKLLAWGGIIVTLLGINLSVLLAYSSTGETNMIPLYGLVIAQAGVVGVGWIITRMLTSFKRRD